MRARVPDLRERGQGRDSEDVSVIRAVGCAGRGSSRKGLEGVLQFAAGGVSSLRPLRESVHSGVMAHERLTVPLKEDWDRSLRVSLNHARCGGTEAGTEEGWSGDARTGRRVRLYDGDPDPPLWRYLPSI
jgi:hypothetical protein